MLEIKVYSITGLKLLFQRKVITFAYLFALVKLIYWEGEIERLVTVLEDFIINVEY